MGRLKLQNNVLDIYNSIWFIMVILCMYEAQHAQLDFAFTYHN